LKPPTRNTIKEEDYPRQSGFYLCGIFLLKSTGKVFSLPQIFPMFFFFSMLLLSFLIETPKRIKRKNADSRQIGPLLVINGVILVILVMLESLKIVCPISKKNILSTKYEKDNKQNT